VYSLCGGWLRASASHVVKASPLRVFWYSADEENAPEWLSLVCEARRVDGTRIGLGSKSYFRADVFGFESEFISEVVEWRPLSRAGLVMVRRIKGPLTDFSMWLSYRGLDGRTRVDLAVEFELGLPPVAKQAVELAAKMSVDGKLRESLRRLSRLLEVMIPLA